MTAAYKIRQPTKKNEDYKLENALAPFGILHFKSRRLYKGKNIEVPICGAMSTFMTDDINMCNCKDCIASIIKFISKIGVDVINKEKGETDE